MARPVMLGNGNLTVGLNEHGLVHDFYYPYVGLENLTTARSVRHMIGVWVDGVFSWVDQGDWEISVDFESDALISNVVMKSHQLAVELRTQDFVDSELDVFCRMITVRNLGEAEREIRLFIHQVFQISSDGRADTALFVPDDNYILDYKGRCSLLIYAEDAQGKAYDQFAVGNYGIEGKEGTFRDAEDGELSGSSVEHGGVDSVIRFSSRLQPDKEMTVNYWVVAEYSQHDAEEVHAVIKTTGLNARINSTRDFWHTWLQTGAEKLKTIPHEHLQSVTKSLLVIKAHTDRRGGVIASCDSSIYNYGRDYYSYVWPRDGAYAMWPLIRMGYTEEPKAFFLFCRDILTKQGYLLHKYQPDGAVGSTWHPVLHEGRKELAFQEDETAIIIYMLGEYYQYTKDEAFVRDIYDSFVRPAANFLASFIDEATGLPHASYDLWEEKFLTSTYTTATVYQALLVAAEFAQMFGYHEEAEAWHATANRITSSAELLINPETSLLRKGLLLKQDGSLSFDETLDVSSLYGAAMFGLFDHRPETLRATLEAVELRLLDQSPSGGAPRYEFDHYFESEPAYSGNPWLVTTLWLAQYYVRIHNYDKASHYIDWAKNTALTSGVMAEQVHPVNVSAVSVAPLVWSHAEFINTVLDSRK